MIKMSYCLKYKLNNEPLYENILLYNIPFTCQNILKGEQRKLIYFAKYMLKVNSMTDYLTKFNKQLRKKWKGSLVKVENVKQIEPNAKKYLNNLAKAKLIKNIAWGWYWVPSKIEDFFDFLRQDKNFKIISAQTAASFWNYDFIHRNTYSIKVTNKSYGKAVQEFSKINSWHVKVEYIKPQSNMKYKKINGLLIENIEENIIDCMKNWAFTDAFATVYENRKNIDFKKILKQSYWRRISRSNVRIKQALEYGFSKMNEAIGKNLFPKRDIEFTDRYIKREINESIEKVMELA
jgi:hypothetical protein